MSSTDWPEITVRDVRLFEVALPLREPFQISGGSMAVRRSYIVELEDEAGSLGWGESAPFEAPFYSEETLASVRACLLDLLAPRVVGRTLSGPEQLHTLLGEGVRGNRMARAGIDTAYWDLLARRARVSLADVVSKRLGQLGLPAAARASRATIECGIALGIPESGRLEDLARDVVDGLRAGFRRVKIKVRPGWDADAVRTARDAIRSTGSTAPLWADANGSFDLHRDRGRLEALDATDLVFLEQPFQADALWDMTMWNRTARVPVCLDETLVSDDVARQVVDMGGPLIWNLKIQRLGGLEEACRVYARGIKAGARMWVGTMPETGLGAQAALAVASFPMAYPSDVEPSARWYRDAHDVVSLRMSDDGLMKVPAVPPVPRRNGWTAIGR
jgi:O-succinylbenzoate synthase